MSFILTFPYMFRFYQGSSEFNSSTDSHCISNTDMEGGGGKGSVSVLASDLASKTEDVC